VPSEDPEEQRQGASGPVGQFQRSVRRSAPVAAASYTLIGGILLLGGLGYLADDWLGTGPWLLLTGLLLGILVGFYELIRVAWGRTR